MDGLTRQNAVSETESLMSLTPLQAKESAVEDTDKGSSRSSSPFLLLDSFALQQAVESGNVKRVRDVLAISPQLLLEADPNKNTALHYAASQARWEEVGHCSEIFNLLLDADNDTYKKSRGMPLVNAINAYGCTALHTVSRLRKRSLICLLLEKGADPTIKDRDGMNALHACVEGESMKRHRPKRYKHLITSKIHWKFTNDGIDCCKVLLEALDITKEEDVGSIRNGMTLLHLAANNLDDKLIKFLLDHGFPSTVGNADGCTPLMIAASQSDSGQAVKCVKLILNKLSSGEINEKSCLGKTAVMMAAYQGHPKVLEVLLSYGVTNMYEVDFRRRTALHWAASSYNSQNKVECARLLLDWETLTRQSLKYVPLLYLYEMEDDKGETPVDIGINHASASIALTSLFFKSDTDLLRSRLSDKMLAKVYSSTPEALLEVMCSGLKCRKARGLLLLQSVSCLFGLITGFDEEITDKPRPETQYLYKVLTSFPDTVTRVMLSHSLVQIFLHLKWKRFQWFVWCSFAFQTIFTIAYTFMVNEIFVPSCIYNQHGFAEEVPPSNHTLAHPTLETPELRLLLSLGFSEDVNHCNANYAAAKTTAVLLYIMVAFSSAKEMAQMLFCSHTYFYQPVNYIQILSLVIIVLNTAPTWQLHTPEWQTRVAAFGVLITWILTLREMSKFPKCGLYFSIMKQVAWKCMLMTAFFLPMIVGFSQCLRILAFEKGQYNYLLFGITKVFIVMTGEVGYDDTFYTEDTPSLKTNDILAHFVILLLVFLTTIILLNLLTGLAVSDVQKLTEEATVTKLADQLELIYQLERMILGLRGTVLRQDFWYRVYGVLNVSARSNSSRLQYMFSWEQVVDMQSLPSELREKIQKEFSEEK